MNLPPRLGGLMESRVTRLLVSESAWPWFFAALIGLFLRRPQSLIHAEFAYEDGKIFYLGSWFGGPLDQLLRPYSGYLYVIPRFVGVLEHAVSPAVAPLAANLAALVIASLVVRFIASDRLATVIPDRNLRWAFALLVIVQPGVDMVLGSITFIQFYLGSFLVAAAIASPARGAVSAALTRAALIATALTGPFSILLLPLYGARLFARRDRDSVWSLSCVGLGAAAQVITLLLTGAGGREAAAPTLAPWDVARVVGIHLATGFTGTRIMSHLVIVWPPFWIAAPAILGLVGLVVLALRSVPRLWLLLAGYMWASIIGSSLIAGSDPTELLLNPLSASRYFVIPWLALGILVIFSATRRNRAAIALVALLAVGIVGDLRLPSGWDYGWTSAATCVGGPAPCEIRIFPGTPYWSLKWPGLDQTTQLPGP